MSVQLFGNVLCCPSTWHIKDERNHGQEVGCICTSPYGAHHAASFATGMNGITTTIVGCS
jgi:hypothetical protein